MKTLLIVECKNCGMKFLGEGIPPIKKGEELDFVLKVIGKCSSCQSLLGRSAGGKRTKPGDFGPGRLR